MLIPVCMQEPEVAMVTVVHKQVYLNNVALQGSFNRAH